MHSRNCRYGALCTGADSNIGLTWAQGLHTLGQISFPSICAGSAVSFCIPGPGRQPQPPLIEVEHGGF
eukprot:COSAG02_NODE_379_length_23528_cov_140.781510_4_plen_68_part_00